MDIFQKMGEDPDNATYTKSGADDVWEFLSKLKTWLVNTNRLGIPA